MSPVRGFVLLPVIVALALLATVAYLLNRDAGMNVALAARGFQAETARYVAEAGLAQMNYKVQASNCAGYPPLNNIAFAGGSFSATALPAAGSPVTLSATATLADGASATLTRSNVVARQTSTSVLNVQPGINGLDTYIDSTKATFNFGASTSIVIKGVAARTYGLLAFDLSAIPPGALIQSGQLSLYTTNASTSGGDTLTVYRVTHPWTEGSGNGAATGDGATWNTSDGATAWSAAGGDYDPASGVSTPFSGTPGWSNFDLTALVSDWVNGVKPNYGLLLMPSAGVSSATISSSDNATAAQRPKLQLSIVPPCGWNPQTTVTLTAVADSYIDGSAWLNNYGSASSLAAYESGQRRSLFEFNTSSIAAGTALANATLRLYVSSLSSRSGGAMNLEAHALTNSWLENKVTWISRIAGFGGFWSTLGGEYQAATSGTLQLPASFDSGWIEIDVTALAQAWIDGVTPNYGLILLETSPDQFSIASREGDPATAPQLVLTY